VPRSPANAALSGHVSEVALDLLRNRTAARPREWLEKRLATGAAGMSSLEVHREIEAGIPGKAIPNLLMLLDFSREDFSELLGRARKTLNELERREHLSRADSDLLYRIARAVVRAASVFGEVDYAVKWLKESNEALGGIVPLTLVATIEGDEVLNAELGAVEHGLPV
jgi:putative toxin-antitoxin system antitoxin component (TIGR02293 family)